MLRRVAVLVVGAAFLSTGCRTQSQWTPTVDTYGSSREQHLERDLEQCRELALESSGHVGEEAARGAVVGGLIGATVGVAIGAALGSPGRGAAIGGAAGGAGQGMGRAEETERQFKRAYINCMRNRGHRVID
jgi:outer membrane lipoprotein SlyB